MRHFSHDIVILRACPELAEGADVPPCGIEPKNLLFPQWVAGPTEKQILLPLCGIRMTTSLLVIQQP